MEVRREKGGRGWWCAVLGFASGFPFFDEWRRGGVE